MADLELGDIVARHRDVETEWGDRMERYNREIE